VQELKFGKTAAMLRDVWITGIGVISSLGSGLREHADAMLAARSGLRPHNLFGGQEPDPCICGMIPETILNVNIEDSAADRGDLLLGRAVGQALDSAGLGRGVRADIITGTTLGNMHGATRYYRDVKSGREPDPRLVRHFLPAMPAECAARENSIDGNHLTVSSACASASAAIGLAFRRVAAGECECAIAGGFDALSPFVVAGFNSLQLISRSLCTPFGAGRTGLNPGEAAAVMVLESKEAAVDRGARLMARIAGFGEALEAYHYTRSDPQGAGTEAALRRALDNAGMTPRNIGLLHLHGTGTEANDRSEYFACLKVFGDRLPSVPACSTKSMTGHTFGAAGALNAVFSVIALRHRVVPPTLNTVNIDPEFTGLNISTELRDAHGLSVVASGALGFGGESSALILSIE
jgi:3-oxoacyl-(acyl-carrier-protein) synthase